MSSDFKPGDAVAQQVQRIPRSGIREFFDLVQGRPNIISLGVGEPDFVTPWHIRESAIYALERGHTSYTSNLGLPKLRAAISGYVAGGFGVSYDPETQILVSVGVSAARGRVEVDLLDAVHVRGEGEAQQLAIGRALMSKPRLLLMDEPSLGLSPLLVEELFGDVVEGPADVD